MQTSCTYLKKIALSITNLILLMTMYNHINSGASWWKRLEGSSRDVLEALDTNQMHGDLLEEYEFEVPE